MAPLWKPAITVVILAGLATILACAQPDPAAEQEQGPAPLESPSTAADRLLRPLARIFQRGLPDGQEVGAPAGPTPPRTPIEFSGTLFLGPNEVELEGFGLNSYLLFGGPPSEARRPVWAASIQALLGMLPTVSDLEPIVENDLSRLNVVYMLIDPDAVPTDSSTRDEFAAGLVDAYDYPRSLSLLSRLRREPAPLDGPYLVSLLEPLGLRAPEDTRPYLWYDLSNVPAEVIPAYIRAFREQARQQEFWREDQMTQYVLNVRTALEIAGEATPEILEVLSLIVLDWIPTGE